MSTFDIPSIWARVAFILALLAGGLFPSISLAALEVEFAAVPLFLNADIKPGDVVSRTVTVRNTGPDSEQVIFDFRNEFSDGLADVMELAVTDASTVYADNFFMSLFALGEIDLGQLSSGGQTTYTFTASLDPSIGNAYQLTEFGFDLVIGFASGETVTDGGGGNGGSSSGGSRFELFNEAVTTPTNSSAELTWNTNRPATSYAVCGNLDDGPFVLDPDDEFFGYQFASAESLTKVLQHEVVFTRLLIGEYECRVASREDMGDDFTVSGTLDFIFSPPGIVEGITTSVPTPAPVQPTVAGNIFTPIGQVAGDSTGGKGTFGGPTYAEWRAELDERRAKEIAAQAAADEALQNEREAEALRERPVVQATSSNLDDDSTGGFLADNWWWLLLLGILAIISARTLAKMRR